ncbi:unnamed protein product [Polarella glacialis]|uniref:SAP domain-containing protein n=1 Tax=Polarella glacialis TaxID=89957 RepID=A0A813JRH3_POLGL|nr:unnamed protein product [Polarella glacialis]
MCARDKGVGPPFLGHSAGPGGFWTRDGPRPSLLPRQQSLQAPQAPSGGWDTVFSSGVAGVLASMVRALRLADESERRRRLRAECCSELRAICVGLRLNFSGSREELVQRIEATLAHDDELAAPERPIGRLIRALAKMPGPTQAADLMAARFRAAELKRLCQPLRLNANGGKALLAGRIALELGSRKPDQGAPACPYLNMSTHRGHCPLVDSAIAPHLCHFQIYRHGHGSECCVPHACY